MQETFTAAMAHLRVMYAFGMEATVTGNVEEKLAVLEKADSRRQGGALLVHGLFGATTMVITGFVVWFSGSFVTQQEVRSQL